MPPGKTTRASITPESYKWCGSHGCINLRLADAKSLHERIKVGLCVVVHS